MIAKVKTKSTLTTYRTLISHMIFDYKILFNKTNIKAFQINSRS